MFSMLVFAFTFVAWVVLVLVYAMVQPEWSFSSVLATCSWEFLRLRATLLVLGGYACRLFLTMLLSFCSTMVPWVLYRADTELAHRTVAKPLFLYSSWIMFGRGCSSQCGSFCCFICACHALPLHFSWTIAVLLSLAATYAASMELSFAGFCAMSLLVASFPSFGIPKPPWWNCRPLQFPWTTSATIRRTLGYSDTRNYCLLCKFVLPSPLVLIALYLSLTNTCGCSVWYSIFFLRTVQFHIPLQQCWCF